MMAEDHDSDSFPCSFADVNASPPSLERRFVKSAGPPLRLMIVQSAFLLTR